MATREEVDELTAALQRLASRVSHKALTTQGTVRTRMIRLQGDLLQATAALGGSATPWSKVPSSDVALALSAIDAADSAVRQVTDLPSARAAGKAVGAAIAALDRLA